MRLAKVSGSPSILRDARACRDWRIQGSWRALLRTRARIWRDVARAGRLEAFKKTPEQRGAAREDTMAQRKSLNVNGKAVRACVTPLSSLTAQQKVVTLEGLGTPQRLHPVQRAFIEEQAAQCGYCINGMIMESAAFLAKTKKPTEAQVKDALANNLCRCGTHARIVKAVMRAAGA